MQTNPPSTLPNLNPKSSRTPIAWAIHYIQNNDLANLENILGTILNTQLEEFTLFRIADKLFQVAAKYNRQGSVPIILKAFDSVEDVIGTRGGDMNYKVLFLTRMFGQNLFEDDIVKFIIKSLRNTVEQAPEFAQEEDIQLYEYDDLVTNLLEAGNTTWIFDALNRAERIFGEQSADFYRDFYNFLKEKGEEYIDSHLGSFISERHSETNEFQAIPSWVQNFEDELPHERDYDMDEIEKEYEEETATEVDQIYATESIETLIGRAIEGFKSMGITEESLKQIKENLQRDLQTKSTEQWHELLDEAIFQEQRRKMVQDIVLFRLYGPAHPIANQHLNTEYISDRFGGCRMFLCDLFDHDDEDEELVYDWFKGSCDYCHKRIRVRWHAVRLPKLTGGWKNCYCSWECTRSDLRGQDLAAAPLIDNFENSLLEKGIQDRLPDD